MEPTEPTAKQQAIELLRSSQALLITTGKNPTIDTIAATIGLTQMLDKMGKRVEAVIGTGLPKSVHFLPTDMIHDRFNGLRDFVIDLDTSRTEADKLKYIPESGHLKIFITPFNGTFTKDNVTFNYGDYHCDGIVVLGAKGPEDIDDAVTSHKELVSKTKLVFMNAGTPAATSGANMLAWGEPQATGLSEMMMSLSEALASGLLDNQIATSLLTGIIASTNHFTGPNTTPKVMTMAAQLLAAGGDQATIVKELGPNVTMANAPATPGQPAGLTPQTNNELTPAREQTLPHKQGKPGRPSSKRRRQRNQSQPVQSQPAPTPPPVTPPPPPTPVTPPSPPPVNPPPPPPPPPVTTPPQPPPPPVQTPPPAPVPVPPTVDIPPPVEVEMKPVGPPQPAPVTPPPPPLPSISDVRAPVDPAPPAASPFDTAPPPPTTLPTSNPILDVDAARKAVEEATRTELTDAPPA